MSWIDIGALEDIPALGARVIKTKLGCIAVFRAADDAVFALSDHCPHKGGPLSEGIVHGHNVTCPLHNMVFSLETGQAQGADEAQVARFDLRVEAGRILIDAVQLAAQSAA